MHAHHCLHLNPVNIWGGMDVGINEQMHDWAHSEQKD